MADQEPIIEKPQGASPRKPDLPTIDISIGHSHLARGATGRMTGRTLREYDFARRVRAAMVEYANTHYKMGFTLRFWDHVEHPKWGMREGKMNHKKILVDRLKAMYQDKSLDPPVKIALALHNNASSNTKYGGSMHIYRMEKDDPDYGTFEDEEGKSLATWLRRAFMNVFPKMKDRGIQADQGDWVERNLGFTRWGYAYEAVPVIIEFGFITCPDDQEVLIQDHTPEMYVRALVNAVQNYLREINE